MNPQVFSDCSDLWGAVVRILAQQHWIQKNTIRKLESAHSYMRLWADGYGVQSGQFEEKLKNSQRAGDLTIKLLQSICRTLTQELTPIVTDILSIASQDATGLSLTAADLALSSERLTVLFQGFNDGEASEDGESVTPSQLPSREKLLDDIADDLRNDTQCLLDLGTRFEEQVINPIVNEVATNHLGSIDSGISDTIFERIARFHPECESNLAECMGKANFLGYVKIAELEYLTGEGRAAPDEDADIVYDATVSEPNKSKLIAEIASTRENPLSRDSIQEISIRNVNESYLNAVRTTPESQSCPPLPEGSFQGEPFRCMACKKLVMITREKEWRAHLLRDIEPYMCPEPGCDAPLFASTSQWENHVVGRHPQPTVWVDSRCRICKKAVNNKDMVIQHLVNHMEAIALAIIPRTPGMTVHNVLVNETNEKSERLASSSKQESEKTSQTELPRVITGCNTCNARRIKCDGEKPSCGNCISSEVICKGYPQTPCLREKGDSLPSSLLGHTSDSEPENAKQQNSIQDWFKRFPASAVNEFSGNLFSTKDGLSAHRAFVKPPLDSTSPIYPTTRRESFTPKFDLDRDWDNSTTLGRPSSDPARTFPTPLTAESTPHTFGRPEYPTKIMSSARGVFPTGKNKPLSPIIVDDPSDVGAIKRARNMLAAQKSREQKAQKLEELEEKIAQLEEKRDAWKRIALNREVERS
ncbi:hypothetical protein GGS24DRAFT_505669 [Hypoxylon argillaceum]|nr:hypothetical protein GGS24DRAFT_505669 [Hypoxylon argillaceum]